MISLENRESKTFPHFLEELVNVKKFQRDTVIDAIDSFLAPLLHPSKKNIEQSSSLQDKFRCRVYKHIANPSMKLTTDDQDQIQSIITLHAFKVFQFPKK